MSLRVLCLDHEGGRGGSSRSLMFALLHMDRRDLYIHVAQRHDSELARGYDERKIDRSVFPAMPIFRAQNGSANTLKQLAVFCLSLVRNRDPIRRFLAFSRSFDLIHANQESTFGLVLLIWLVQRKRIVFHFRSRIQVSWAARLQIAVMNRIGAEFVFITENERDHYAALGARSDQQRVVYNPAIIPQAPVGPDPRVAADKRFKLCLIGNYAKVRGQDRIIPILLELRRLGVLDRYVVVVAGETAVPRSELPDDEASRAMPAQTSFVDYVDRLGLAAAFIFIGHTQQPEQIVVGADIVLKLGRLNEPWGRDVIEAYALGRPVLGIGTWSRFVEHRQTGLLYAEFDPEQAARDLEDMRQNPALGANWGDRGRARIRQLCDPDTVAAQLLAVWQTAAARPAGGHLADGAPY